jgi:hypothetical protein
VKKRDGCKIATRIRWSVLQTSLFLLLLGTVLSVVLVLSITASPGH